MRLRAGRLAVLAALALAGCSGDGKKEEEPSRDTFECTLQGERYVVRFTEGEARLLPPDGNRINLYQIPAASGVRFSNGFVELRGKGMELQLVQDGVAQRLEGCKPVMIPKGEPGLFEKRTTEPK